MRVAIIGMGRAGRARLRDLQAAPEHAVVHTVAVRDGPAAIDAALGDNGVDAVVICAANDLHAQLVRDALAAGRHVLCEFPLAADATTTQALFLAAAAARRVLHVELVGVLTTTHQGWQRAFAAQAPARVICRFQGGLYRWTADESQAGRYGQLAIGRLHQLWDLAGPLTLGSAVLTRVLGPNGDDGYRIDVQLRGARYGGVDVTLVEARAPSLVRGLTLSAFDAQGAAMSPAANAPAPAATTGTDGAAPPADAPSKERLFARDFEVFAARVDDAERANGRGSYVDRGGYVDDATVVAVAKLADAISGAISAAVPVADVDAAPGAAAASTAR